MIKRFFKTFLAILIIILFVMISLSIGHKNSELITLSYYFDTQITLSVAGLLIAPFVLGLLVGLLLMFLSLFTQKLKTGSANRKIVKLEKQIEQLQLTAEEG